MTRRSVTCFGSFILAAALAVGLVRPARVCGETSTYELCIEQSPAKAGKVTPNSGTHRFSANTVVVLSAEPQPGYRFVYWLGDVADPGSQRTTTHVNAPKIVVAVFQPDEKDRFKEQFSAGGGGGGALAPTAVDLSAPGWSPAGGGKSRTQTVVVPVIVTPEPTTIILLGLGTLALRRRKRRAI